MNAQTKLSTKGQMVVPAELREALGFKPGDVLNARKEGEKLIVERAKPPKKGGFFDLYKPPAYKGPPISVEDMDQAIGDAVMARYRRSLPKP
jgi:AbrB family looped-hinge helix DNA binding protein